MCKRVSFHEYDASSYHQEDTVHHRTGKTSKAKNRYVLSGTFQLRVTTSTWSPNPKYEHEAYIATTPTWFPTPSLPTIHLTYNPGVDCQVATLQTSVLANVCRSLWEYQRLWL